MDQNNNPWLKLTTAPIFQKGNYFKPGNYKLKETQSITKRTRKGVSAWIVEFEVLESDNPFHPIGSKGTWYQEIDSDSGPPAINAWLMAMFGFTDPDKFLAQYAQHLPAIMQAAETQGYWHTQPGVGTVALSTHKKWTKNNRIFTVHDWAPFTPPAGWQPKPTPATAAMPQEDPPREGVQMPLVYGGPPQGYQGYGGPPAPQAYPQPGFNPAAPYPMAPQAQPAPTAPQAPAWGPPAPGVPGGWPPPR